MVYETVEKSRRFTGQSDVLLSVSCATCSRICVPVLALESNQRTGETTWRFSTACTSGHFNNIPYDEVRRTHNIPTLAERRLDLSRTFFKRIIRDNSTVLWYLLPAKRDPQLTTRLRCARQYSTIYARTNRYKNSLIIYGLNHWQ